MDKLLFIKKNKGIFVLYAFIIAASLILIVGLLLLSLSGKELNNQIFVLEKQLTKSRTAGSILGDGAVFSLESIKGNFERDYADYASRFSVKSPLSQETLNPLAFKQNLLETQDRLRNRADKAKISLPYGLGFAEYELKVPEPVQIESLYEKLKLMEEIVGVLLDSHIAEISRIEFVGQNKNEREAKNKEVQPVFKSKIVNIELKSNFSAFKNFLANLAKENTIFIFKKINIQRNDKENGILISNIELEALGF